MGEVKINREMRNGSMVFAPFSQVVPTQRQREDRQSVGVNIKRFIYSLTISASIDIIRQTIV